MSKPSAPPQVLKRLAQKIGDAMFIGGAVLAALSVAGTGGWWVISPRLEPFIGHWHTIEVMLKNLGDPQIALYHPGRTYMVTPKCPVHNDPVCTARFQLKRTPYGTNCKITGITAYVRSSEGIETQVSLVSGVQDVGALWRQVDVTFVPPPPNRASRGPAIYWSIQHYMCPSVQDPTVMVPREEISPVLPFELWLGS